MPLPFYALALIAGGTVAQAPAPVGPDFFNTSFDKPLAVQRVDLGPAETSPGARKEVRCAYFPGFAVKEIDERELGDAQLSILPGNAPCQRTNLPGERVVNPDKWSGYFAGVHGRAVFFAAYDGVEGGMGFAVVRPSDAAILYTGIAKSRLNFANDGAGRALLHFEALYTGPCSVPDKGESCAAEIGREAGVQPPDVRMCTLTYDAARPVATTALDKVARKDPSVISFHVTVTLDDTSAVSHAEGAPTACWMAE